MGAEDKIKAAAEKVAGKVKETVGTVTGNDDLAAEGKAEQAKGHARAGAEKFMYVYKMSGRRGGGPPEPPPDASQVGAESSDPRGHPFRIRMGIGPRGGVDGRRTLSQSARARGRRYRRRTGDGR